MERKQNGRVRIQRRATIRLSRGLRVVVRTVDLSITGMGFVYSAPAEVGAMLEIEFGLPGPDSVSAIKLYGEVYHSHLLSDQFYTRLKFIKLSDRDRGLLEQFIQTRKQRSQDTR